VTNINHSERKFFMHPPHKSIGVSTGSVALRACLPAKPRPASPRTPPLRLGMIGFPVSAKSDWIYEVLWARLKQYGPATCDRLLPIADDDRWDDSYWQSLDCLILGDWPEMDNINGEAIRRFCRRGGGIVSLGVTGPASDERTGFDHDVLGRGLDSSTGEREIPTAIIAACDDHPVVTDTTPFVANLCRTPQAKIAEDAVTLLHGLSAQGLAPVAWVRRYCGGRVFSTSLGTPQDFGEPEFLRLLGAAIRWTAGQRT